MKLSGAGMALLLWAAQAAWAQAPAAPPPSRNMVEQKYVLANKMLFLAPSAQRVELSNNAEAKRLLAEAREDFVKARAALDAEDLKQTDELLSAALRKGGKAARMVPDTALQEREQRERYASLLKEIQDFRASYVTSQKMLGAQAQSSAQAQEMGQIGDLVDKAQKLADAGRWEDANQSLGQAHSIVVTSMSRLLAAKTITYDLNFETPAAEYEYELARLQSFEGLVPLALANFKPSPEVAKLVEEFVSKGQSLREQARKQAAKGDYPAALESLQGATGFMQTAIEQAGVATPGQ